MKTCFKSVHAGRVKRLKWQGRITNAWWYRGINSDGERTKHNEVGNETLKYERYGTKETSGVRWEAGRQTGIQAEGQKN